MSDPEITPRRRFSEDPVKDMETRIARALNHPVRAEILAALNEGPAAPSDIADRWPDRTLANISYHFRTLHELELAEPIEAEHVRGTVKTTYRGTARMMLDNEEWPKLSDTAKNGLTLFAFSAVLERARVAMAAGTFDARDDRHLSTTSLRVDEAGWGRIVQICDSALAEVMEIESECAERAKKHDERFKSTISLLYYESPRSRRQAFGDSPST
jgi:DNA-binding transcriptional ArsR family regulator